MVNTCVVYGERSGYIWKPKKENKTVSSFSFPFNKPDLLKTWIKFVNRADWSPTSNSVICIKHFEENLIIDNQKQKKLNYFKPLKFEPSANYQHLSSIGTTVNFANFKLI